MSRSTPQWSESTSAEVEQWKPIPDLAGYEASNLGRVRSLRRSTPHVLKGTVGPCGFTTVAVSTLAGPGGRCRRVGTLVAAAWIGPLPGCAEVRRLDGDPKNDRLENLAYGSLAEVDADHAARARREEAAGAPTHCPDGHRYADTWLGNWGDRYCPGCQRVRQSTERERERARGYNRRWHKAHYKPRKARTTPCVDCGAEVQQNPGPGGIILRCPTCRDEQKQVYQLRYRAKGPREPRLSYCIDCGAKILNTGPGPKARRCPPHKMLAQRAASELYEQRHRRRGVAA